ncbi:HAMP domain-containing sensor histidine kinase [Fredinandcohnia sp. QZ13]|uniref:HAMP domain-containing sensor histidine kinase n=1 Tax=Fredinandcohnia sp. QZ13 TaxID=3073144 RepID=UPI00285330E0|nr:HAMP domain-containing sensor histidine kinase [Fredinandcohnia sp. QZ13]MDR4889654.1 HAMP domain-containing sensor histidine kinase [Fredinandcohnia sp. QZ13]
MKFRYMFQQLVSHISVIVVAFVILSIVFAHYVGNLVFEEKVQELTTYGENIITDISRTSNVDGLIRQYSNMLAERNILFTVFDENGVSLSAVGGFVPQVELKKKEWDKVRSGHIVSVKQDYKRFEQEVTFIVMPYMVGQTFVGGVLLASPISGTQEMIHDINQYLFYTMFLALAVAILMSWLLSTIHVKRIKRLRKATSMISDGDYSVELPSSDFDEIGELSKDFNKMAQRLQKSMEEIESLESRRRKFMADVSHEMRTPLTTISGVIEGLKNDLIPEEEKEKGVQLVSQETKRLIRLVNENLDYEKIRSNQVTLQKETIELVEVLEVVKDTLEPQADEKNDQIIVEVPEGLMITADYDRLIQILINIIKNSIQFTDNGTIWIRGRAGEHETVIEIEDTGVGIDSSEIENIWHRFYKADVSRTGTPFGQFGLGLSIVKQLVQLHNGKIEVSSEKGKGTKFVIRIPSE